jgi:TP901 family phage tail tape measure protein
MATTVATLAVRVTALLGDFEKQMASMEKKWARQGAKFQSIGRDLTTGLTLPLAAVSGLAIKAASDFESSFAGVRKTVDGVVDKGGNLTAFGKELQQKFRNLAKEIPVSVNELNRIGESAGQLGIKSENIIDFTKTIAAMGVATNLTTEQAADGMARFANITQMPQENIGRLGSTIVELGNKLAATESEILEFGLRIAGAGEIVGLTEAQIMGIAGAFSSVGIEAEAGGTAVQKALLSMQSAVTTGKGLGAFGGQAFADKWKTNQGNAFIGFVEAVGRAGTGGEQMLRNAGIDDARQIRSFLSIAAAGDLLSKSLGLAATEWVRNEALMREADQRYRTFASQVVILRNVIYDAGITLGNVLIAALQRMMPAIETVLGGIVALVDLFSRLPVPVQTTVFALAGLAAAAGPAMYLFGTLMKAGGAIFATFKLLPGVFRMAGSVLGWFGGTVVALLGPLAAFVGAMAAVNAVGKSDTFQRWVSTGDGFMAGAARMVTGWGAGKLGGFDKLTTAQYEAARAKMDGTATSAAASMPPEVANFQKQIEAAMSGAGALNIDPKASEKEQALNAQLERRKELTGETVRAAARLMVSDLKGIDIAILSAEKTRHVNETLVEGIEAYGRIGQAAPQSMRALASATMPVLEEVGDSAQNIASLAGTMSDRMRELSEPIEPIWVEALPTAEESLANIASLTGTVTDNLREMGDVKPPSAWDGFFDPQGLQQFADILYRLANDIGGAAGNIVGGIGGIMGGIAGYQQAGGAPKGAMGKIGALANMAGAVWGSAQAGGGAGMNALSGAMSGAATGMAFGPWGAAIGAGAGAAVGWAKSMMVSQDEKDAREEAIAFQNELIAKFAETATAAQLAEGQGERWRVVNIAVRDAYLAIGKSEADAMRDLERFNNATRQSAEAVQQAAGVIAMALEEQAADQERLNSAIQRYGFEWEELGAKFRQTQLNNGAKELIEDWRVLVASGISMETVNTRMAGAMNEYLQSALTVGAEVPLAMQPILQSFADQGLLVDAAGNKITDLSAAGINFTETMAAGFDRVIVKLDQLINSLIAAGTAIDPLSGSVVAAAGGGPQSKPGTYRDWVVYYEQQDGSASVPDMIQAMKNAAAGMPIPMAEGGIVRSPTFAMIGEAGPEAVVPLDSDGGIPGGSGLQIHFHGDVYDGDSVTTKIANWYHGAIEKGGKSRSDARRLGLVPA